MSPLPHPIPPEWLMAYHDGELGALRLAQVEAHLPACAQCRQDLAQLAQLSAALAADALPSAPRAAAGSSALAGSSAAAGSAAAAGADDFWPRLQAQLPQRPAPASPAGLPGRVSAELSAWQVLLRWLPGIGLLLLNGAVQVLALGLTALMLLPMSLAQAPAWLSALLPLASGATLGWLGWLAPATWSGWELFGFWLLVSAELAVLYLAWLGYELRHGPHHAFGRPMTLRGA